MHGIALKQVALKDEQKKKNQPRKYYCAKQLQVYLILLLDLHFKP